MNKEFIQPRYDEGGFAGIPDRITATPLQRTTPHRRKGAVGRRSANLDEAELRLQDHLLGRGAFGLAAEHEGLRPEGGGAQARGDRKLHEAHALVVRTELGEGIGLAGEVELECVPQGTLVERMRAYTMLGDTVADAYAALMPKYGFRKTVAMLVEAFRPSEQWPGCSSCSLITFRMKDRCLSNSL